MTCSNSKVLNFLLTVFQQLDYRLSKYPPISHLLLIDGNSNPLKKLVCQAEEDAINLNVEHLNNSVTGLGNLIKMQPKVVKPKSNAKKPKKAKA